MTVRAALAAVVALLALARSPAHGQLALSPDDASNPGYQASPEEREAWALAEAGRHIRAREQAEAILRRDPNSFVASLVVGYVLHYAEADFPRSLFHLQRALALFEARHGSAPDPSKPWRWHATLLRELANVHGTLEHYAERLAFIARFNMLYEPDLVADRAWPLMKLGRYAEARAAADRGLRIAERPSQQLIAQNALCAIEFEAGNDGASYLACKQAVDAARASRGEVSAVDLTNFAESSRSLFKLDEAERISLEATSAELSWYGSPWMDLAELYTREGRFGEALAALKHIPGYRALRPPHVRDADRNETRRVVASFLLVLGRAREALEVTERAVHLPDRRSHNSRDPGQDEIVSALLDRAAKRLLAEQLGEQAAAEPVYRRPWWWAQAAWLRVRSWASGAAAERLLREPQRLAGIFRVGTAASAILPPWLAGDLVAILGAGVAEETLARARRIDKRAGVGAYYDAFTAEAALAGGDPERASRLARAAVGGLSPAEVLLRARTLALAAEADRQRGDLAAAVRKYQDAFQIDPGVFRRLSLPVPVLVQARGSAVAATVASRLSASPRLVPAQPGLFLRIEADAVSGSACLVGTDGSLIGCGRGVAQAGDDASALARRICADFHERVFAPRVDLTQSDISSLDGSNLIRDDALQTLLDGKGP